MKITDLVPKNAPVVHRATAALTDIGDPRAVTVTTYDTDNDGKADVLVAEQRLAGRQEVSVHRLTPTGREDFFGAEDGSIRRRVIGTEGARPTDWTMRQETVTPSGTAVTINRPRTDADPPAPMVPDATVTRRDGAVEETIRGPNHPAERNRERFDQLIPGGLTGVAIAIALKKR